MENAHEGHRQRIRDKLLKGGPESMKPHELVEFLLYYCVPRQNTNPIAHALLDRFGSLESLFSADEADIVQVPGMTALSARWLHAVGRCVFAYIDAEDHDTFLKNRRDARIYMERFFRHSGLMGCWLMCLSAAGCVTHLLPLQGDGEWHSPENLRRAVAFALQCRAHSIILAHRRDDHRLAEAEVRFIARLMHSLSLIRITLIEYMTMSTDGSQVDYATNPLIYQISGDDDAAQEDSRLLAHWLDET